MDRTSAKWVAGGSVVVLAIVAVVLVVLAMQRVSGVDAPDETVAPVPTFGAKPSATPTPTLEPTPTAAPLYDRSQERFLSIGTGVMWRGVAGACTSTEPLLERSTDGGETWTDVTPRYLEIGSISAVSAFAGAEGEIIAAMGAECEVQALRTFTQGQFWEPYPEVLASAMYVDPANPGSIVVPGGTVAAPCADARGLRSAGGLTGLVCEGIVYVLGADAAWHPLGAEAVTALTVSNGGVVVSHRTTSCAGLTITSFPDTANAASAEELACIEVADTAVPTALSVTEGNVLVWSGDSLRSFPL